MAEKQKPIQDRWAQDSITIIPPKKKTVKSTPKKTVKRGK